MSVKTLADIQVGDEFIFVCQCTAIDPTNGMSLSLYGPSSTLAAQGAISPTGVLSGQIADVPSNIPVNVVAGFTPVSVGDVLQDGGGSTFVVMWCQIESDGTVFWSNSPSASVKYPVRGYTKVGHIPIS